MTGEQITFLVVAFVVLGSALMVVTTGNLVHAALWLISTLFGVAVIFALLSASFLAVVQVVVYIGAIAILFIFAVMLTRKDMRDQGPQLNKNWWVGALLAVLTYITMPSRLSRSTGFGFSEGNFANRSISSWACLRPVMSLKTVSIAGLPA